MNVQVPGGPDVTRRNQRSLLYITTDPTADNEALEDDNNAPNGSIRLVFTPGDTMPSVQVKVLGVWNLSGFRVAANSIGFGFGLILSAIVGFLETTDAVEVLGHQRAYLPHTEVGLLGMTEFTFAARTDFTKVFDVFVGPVSEITATGTPFTIGVNFDVDIPRAVTLSLHEVGTLGASSPVVVRFFKGTDNTGILLSEKTLPAGALLANAPLFIEYDKSLGFAEDEPVFQEFTSDSPFSLQTDISGNVLTSHIGNEIRHLQINTENQMFDENLDVMLDEELNPMYAKQFLAA